MLITIAILSIAATSSAQQASAPSIEREGSMSVGLGHVLVYQGSTLGDRVNIGGGFGIFHRSGIGVEIEINRTLGFAPGLAPCAIEGTFCYGTTHTGIRPPTVMAAVVHYRFKGQRVRPYLTGGIGALFSRSVQPTSPVGGPEIIHTEAEVGETGYGPDLGAGLRVAVSRRFSVSPEIRWLDAPWLSGANLAVTRIVARTAYSW
jgi:hypothetical protein